jgi:hypothetical protein
MIVLNRTRQMILASVFVVPMMVGVGAIAQLVSLDASVSTPLHRPTLEAGAEQPEVPEKPSVPNEKSTKSTEPTDRERHNVAMTQLQDGDWLMKRGDLKAAKGFYQAAIDRSDADSDIHRLATARLEKLERAIVAANTQDKTKESAKAKKQTSQSLKKSSDKSSNKLLDKSTVKSTVKSIEQTKKPTEKLAVKPVDSTDDPSDRWEPIGVPQPDVKFVTEPIEQGSMVGQPENFEQMPQSSDINWHSDLKLVPSTGPLPDAWLPVNDRVTPPIERRSAGE